MRRGWAQRAMCHTIVEAHEDPRVLVSIIIVIVIDMSGVQLYYDSIAETVDTHV